MRVVLLLQLFLQFCQCSCPGRTSTQVFTFKIISKLFPRTVFTDDPVGEKFLNEKILILIGFHSSILKV